ncbi:lysozyme [Roseibium album]|uniref:lysozyme n=1 Tax=Roseibium album TaxID=311410 RepID=UPI00391A3F50
MARLERFQGTQRLPGVRQPGVVADTAVGQATAAAGGQIQRTGAQVGHIAELAQQRQLKIDDFQRKKGWLDFEGQFSEKELEAQQNLKPGAAGYTKSMQAQFDTDAAKFIESLPDSAKAQAEIDVKNLRNRYTDRFTRTEQKESTRYFQEGIAEGSDQIAKNIRANPNTYDEALEQGRSLINESGLPRIEKEAALKAWERMASIAWVETLPAAERAQLFGASRVDAGSLIRAKEGFRTKAYWDVNHHRVGYGSDTVTRADGSVEKVTKDTVITQADAERDLERRIEEFQVTAMKQVGAEAWQRLPPRAQAALTSIVYNYGELPKRLHSAVQSGDIEQIAGAVEGLKSDNGGVNSKRRQEEANIIRGHAAIPNASPEIQERLDSLSYEDQVKFSDQANRDLVSVASDRQDGFRLQIATDPLTVDRQQIIDDPMLDDGQKASLINSLNSALKQGEKVRNAIDWVNTSGNGNPLNPDDRNNADLVYEQAVEAEQDPTVVARAITASKGVVPKTYVNDIRNGMRSNDAMQVGGAYERAAALYDINPQAVRGAENGQELEDAVTKWRLFTDGMGLDAMEAGQRLAELNSPEALKAREAMLESQPVKDYLKEVEAGDIEGMFDQGLLSFTPDLGADAEGRAVAVTEFKQLFKESLGEVGGDLDAAQELAFQRMSRNWGVSEFSPHGSGVVLKHPTEKLYPPIGEDGHKYVRDQAKAVLEEEGIDARRFFLVGNQYTVADERAGRPPRLTVVYDDQDGVRQQLNTAFFADYDAALAEEAAREAADFELNGERYLQEREDGLARKALGDSTRPSEMGGTPFQQMQRATEEFRQLEEAGQ